MPSHRLCSRIAHANIVGFDMEWVSQLALSRMRQERAHKLQHQPISLIQISTETDCLLFRLRLLGGMPEVQHGLGFMSSGSRQSHSGHCFLLLSVVSGAEAIVIGPPSV